MTRVSKTVMVVGLILFVLACNFATQPFRDVQNVAETAQAVTTLIPV